MEERARGEEKDKRMLTNMHCARTCSEIYTISFNPQNYPVR